jgi:hypothetical protein
MAIQIHFATPFQFTVLLLLLRHCALSVWRCSHGQCCSGPECANPPNLHWSRTTGKTEIKVKIKMPKRMILTYSRVSSAKVHHYWRLTNKNFYFKKLYFPNIILCRTRIWTSIPWYVMYRNFFLCDLQNKKDTRCQIIAYNIKNKW